MAIIPRASVLLYFLLASRAHALQVTANSPCAPRCLGVADGLASNPNSSNTTGSEIACLDTSFDTSEPGKRFQSCMSCLQISSAYSDGDRNDQAWFIYNLRFALSSCLFGYQNTTDSITTSCSTQESCGPLQDALADGDSLLANEATYDYCRADQNAILGRHLSKCISCLRTGGTHVYLANFLKALEAGCVQQPPAGTVIGLDGTVFSTNSVNITSPGYISGVSVKENQGLSQNSVIIISVALSMLILVTIATIFICWRKRKILERNKRLHSPLNARFGAQNITAPNQGAYTDPARFAFPRKVVNIRNQVISHPIPPPDTPKGVVDLSYKPSLSYTPSPSSIPRHQAHINTNDPDVYDLPPYPAATKQTPQFFPPPPPPPKQPQPPPRRTHKFIPARLSPNTNTKTTPHKSPSYSSTTPNSTVHTPGSPPGSATTQFTNFSAASSPRHQQEHSYGHKPKLSNASEATVPVNISGPLVSKDSRYDFDEAGREADRRGRGNNTWSPESTVSEEQWPGNY